MPESLLSRLRRSLCWAFAAGVALGGIVPVVHAQEEPTPREARLISMMPRAARDFGDETVVRLSQSDLHPDLLHQPFFGGAVLSEPGSPSARTLQAFRDLLDQYVQRQGGDDNFTVRVTDDRSGNTLEVFTLTEERDRYERGAKTDWPTIDEQRREHTRRLIDKWEKRGIPRASITVKWGRADQVREARQRELPHLYFEMRLARYLGLSLLATEIGTVETFNDDRLVSGAGARGRYQMMPYLLRSNGISRYSLGTAGGRDVTVTEEWHPLLTMEPAFVTLKGYINAVGHEIPGISAYHAGPGNIFRIYRLFLERGGRRVGPGATVADAYVWALTDGFDVVSPGSSFGQYSRGYVPAVYGSLRAVDNLTIDTTQTVWAEQVRVKAGREVFLSQLLRTLERQADRLAWGGLREGSFYERFRRLNPHMLLPEGGPGVPVRGDVRLVASAKGVPVRFFLPLGATDALAAAGLDVLDERATRRYDRNVYAVSERDKTAWDRDYDALVQDIARFGFTARNRARLSSIKNRFEQLARENPTPYRQTQLAVIEIHSRLWEASVWNDLAAAVSANANKLAGP